MALPQSELYQWAWGGGMKKRREFVEHIVVKAMPGIRDGVRSALSADGGATTWQIVEIVTAQIALHLALEDREFDSFEFAAKCRNAKL